MAEFFQLNSPAEDKVISRETKILTDVLSVETTGTFTIATTSTAKRQKIKFFVDVISFLDLSPVTPPTPPHTLNYYKIGKYFELEHTETAQLINTYYSDIGGQSFSILYTCNENDGSGNFEATLSITADIHPELSTYTMYLSSIVTEDSFFNPTLAWLNPSNPNNLIGLLEPIPINGNRGGLPGGGNVGDMLVNVMPGAVDWASKDAVVNSTDMPKTSSTNFGVCKIDGTTITAVNGVLSATSGDTPPYDMEVEHATNAFYRGKQIFEITFFNTMPAATGTKIIGAFPITFNISQIIDMKGAFTASTVDRMPFDYINGTSNAILSATYVPASNQINISVYTSLAAYYSKPCNVTVRYVKSPL